MSTGEGAIGSAARQLRRCRRVHAISPLASMWQSLRTSLRKSWLWPGPRQMSWRTSLTSRRSDAA